ncbi:MAG: sodium:solute symporter, partial [Bacteroidetes bacterium]|nr:sodium:solute symporter [Bacteroidota bacterium]
FAENLIQFVNIIGSLFYGTILGIFLTAFYLKRVKGTAVFWSAIAGETVVLICYRFYYDEIAFLYYNIIGCLVVVGLSLILQLIFGEKEKATV